MAWDTTLVEQLRYVIGDYDSSNYYYSSANLKKFLLVAAYQTLEALASWGIDANYQIDLDGSTISPDPTSDVAYRSFANLMVIKAACLIGSSQLRFMSMKTGYKVVDDKSTIDTTGVMESLKDNVKTFCDGYQQAIKEFKENSTKTNVGSAILGPYVPYLSINNNVETITDE